MKLSWFKREDGSTTLTMILAIALVVVLLAASVQWYWTHSSSSDIQVLADLGALAAADVSAKSVMLIQALDAMLLTANLFGLLLHAIVVVAGVVTVLSAPAGGGAAPFFEKALEFDRKFCEKRRDFAKQAHKLAQAVSEATPYLAMAQAYHVVSENATQLEEFNGTSYFAAAIPFPFRGELELTGYPADEDELLEEVSTAGEENEASARDIKKLEGEIERGVDECFRLDIYKPAGTQRAYWNPLQAIADFRRGFSELAGEPPPLGSTLIPIEDNARNRQRLFGFVQHTYMRKYKVAHHHDGEHQDQEQERYLDQFVNGVLDRTHVHRHANARCDALRVRGYDDWVQAIDRDDVAYGEQKYKVIQSGGEIADDQARDHLLAPDFIVQLARKPAEQDRYGHR